MPPRHLGRALARVGETQRGNESLIDSTNARRAHRRWKRFILKNWRVSMNALRLVLAMALVTLVLGCNGPSVTLPTSGTAPQIMKVELPKDRLERPDATTSKKPE